ncbi:hypothetical protein JTE90_006451 [Oedothorax gibbosus]|uniref:Gustatory receptor n=1 Tax=Oedothorax gibbosus TaxID=931172 RepID=A0AAV6UGT6_9ARAC|nr:hypothetical protein JTE90_006451 [Oedothorax gibbosus]
MYEFLSFYSKVEMAVLSSENALSPLTFFVYTYILCCLFQVTGVLVTSVVSKEVIGTSLILLLLSMCLLVSGIAGFVALSVHTSLVYRSALLVRRRVFNLLSTHKRSPRTDFSLYAIVLLLADDYPRQTGTMTGWGFFELDGQFALKAVGGIITYAVILIQVSDLDHPLKWT